jgi:hypothetical protein
VEGADTVDMDCCNASVVSYRRLYTSTRKVFLKRCKLILHHAPSVRETKPGGQAKWLR